MIQNNGGGGTSSSTWTATGSKAIDLGILGGGVSFRQAGWANPNASLGSEPYITGSTNGALFVSRIPAVAGSILTGIRVKYQGDGGSGGLKLRIYKRLESGGVTAMTLVGTEQTMLSGTVASTTYTLAAPETIAADTSYYAEVEAVVTGSGTSLFDIQAIFSSRDL